MNGLNPLDIWFTTFNLYCYGSKSQGLIVWSSLMQVKHIKPPHRLENGSRSLFRVTDPTSKVMRLCIGQGTVMSLWEPHLIPDIMISNSGWEKNDWTHKSQNWNGSQGLLLQRTHLPHTKEKHVLSCFLSSHWKWTSFTQMFVIIHQPGWRVD